MNPLLEPFRTPFNTAPFDKILNEHYIPAIHEAIKIGRQEIEFIKKNLESPNFKNTIEALDRSGEKIGIISSIFFNLNSANTNDEIQSLAREISPLLTEYGNDITLDKDLFERVNKIYMEKHVLQLNNEEFTLLDKTYKSFIRNGANLDEKDKETLREIDKTLSQLSLLFGEHVLDETNKYKLVISDISDLKGLPDFAVEAAALAAKESGEDGKWVITLQHPSFIPFMTYAENRNYRHQLFIASGTKANKGDENDNKSVILQIAKLRHQRANLLGYPSHAAFVLEERMAESPEKVSAFLNDLLSHTRQPAEDELSELKNFSENMGGPDEFEKWDMLYYSEKLRKEKYALDEEMLKPYFKLENVIDGIFTIANKLYKLNFKALQNVAVYHPDVKVYEVTNEKNEHIAIYYADYFPRAGKQNGAWMTSYKGQKKMQNVDHRPHISIVCNFTKPTTTRPSLLTFNEVTTLFHEFGHALHGMLANGKFESLSGTNVFWDFVELPSQIMENWAYEKESLDLFAFHYQTGEVIPAEFVTKIKKSANFLEAYQTVRQVSLAKLDLGWHLENADQITDVRQHEKELLRDTELLPAVAETNTSCSFSHIFQGGYSAGYYSYKWAEVLDADAFEYFLETGIFNSETARKFQEYILSAGGSEHPMLLYKKFRGQEPSINALLRRTGILNS